jgi:hypothetical protein
MKGFVVKTFVLKLVAPFILGGALFGYLDVYRKGWAAATYGGADPWAPFFTALGGVTAPFALALLVAGLVKFFTRRFSFLNVWLTVFLTAVAILGFSSFTVARYKRANAETTQADVMQSCRVSADFSNKASTNEIDSTEKYSGKTWRRIDIYENGFSSLDCYLVAPSGMFGAMSPVDILLAWAAQEGLEQEGIFAIETPYPHSRMVSSKVVEGREVVFEHRIFLFQDSFVLAATASDRVNFPSDQNRNFLASLKVTTGNP